MMSASTLKKSNKNKSKATSMVAEKKNPVRPQDEQPRAKRTRLSYEDKKSILQELNFDSKDNVRKKYGISERTLRKWRTEKDKIFYMCESRANNMKTARDVAEMDDRVFTFLCEANINGTPVTGPMLRQEALKINKELGGRGNFRASQGWIGAWKHRIGVQSLTITDSQMKHLSSATGKPQYETLAVTVTKPFVYSVQLNRPTKLNALNDTMWKEINNCFKELADDADCRVIILSGAGKGFCAGIDLQSAMSLGQGLGEHEDIARKCKFLEKKIKLYQESLTSIEQCPKPVIAAAHGASVGAGVDMLCATDIRYCSSNAWFQIKEVELGMTADVGTLQRLPKIIGCNSLLRELAYTGRKFSSNEALQCGFVNRLFDDENALMVAALDVAEQIASKSPVAVQGTKISLNYSRDHTVQEGLDHIALRNQAMLQSEDFMKAAVASATKGDPPVFSKL